MLINIDKRKEIRIRYINEKKTRANTSMLFYIFFCHGSFMFQKITNEGNLFAVAR